MRDVAAIARARGLAISTIAGHLERLITDGAIDDIEGLVEDGVAAAIRAEAGGQPFRELAPMKERLGDSVTFTDLKLVRGQLAAEERRR
jgi:ATP-dependent DNA helicase RecQ